MIAVSNSGRSFRDLADYLVNGRTGREQGRVAWSVGRNLPTDDPELAAVFMTATATQNANVARPVYHIAVSFDPRDPVDRATMERVADRVLARLGLSEHQTIIVAHRDREHAHVHLVVNRVHPDTLKAWERWQDQPVIQQVLREEEQALGLRIVPGRLAPSLERTVSERTSPARDLGADTDAPPTRDRTNGMPQPTAPTPHRASFGRTSRVEVIAQALRTYERVAALSRESYQAGIEASAASARVAELDLAVEGARAADNAFRRALGTVYRDPDAGHRAYIDLARAHGVAQATRVMQQQPERFGALLKLESRHALRLVRATDDRSARAAAREAAERGAHAIHTERVLWTRMAELRVRRLEDTFVRALRAIYADPACAHAAVEAFVHTHGVERAAEALRESPEQFGDLRTATHDGAKVHARARAAASFLVEAAHAKDTAAVASLESEAGVAIEQRALQDDAARSATRMRRIQRTLTRAPERMGLSAQLTLGLRALSLRDIDRLRRIVTAPQYAIAEQFGRVARAAVLGREEEREA